MIVFNLNTKEFLDATDREAFAMQLRGTHVLVHNSAYYSYQYARDVLAKPFPAGEAAIATDAEISYHYAKYILVQRFPAGEAAIATDAYYSNGYAKRFNLNLIDGEFQA